MAQATCAMCFKRKDCAAPFPGCEAVCRGCYLDLERATGWLERQGWGLVSGSTGQTIGVPAIDVGSLPGLGSGNRDVGDAARVAQPDPPNPPAATVEPGLAPDTVEAISGVPRGRVTKP